MCGIAGSYNARLETSLISKVTQRLTHRGPDDQRYYQHNDVTLIHTRLSIIDLSDLGSQPYKFQNLVLTYNGELYNYKEIREELKKHGYEFDSNSDSEVLIKSFHLWGATCVERFIGMFAFCIYDETRDELFVFRDRVGVKPLYYSYERGEFFFASELRALREFRVSNAINLNAVSMYFRFGFIPYDLSIYSSVSKLEPGYWLKVSRQGIQKSCYWNAQHQSEENRSESDWQDELESLLISAFRYRMVSDVPVGVFLSGGIDSSLLTAMLQKYHGGIHTFTIGFKESQFDESPFAQKVAEHLKTDHTHKMLMLEEARKLLHNFYAIYDEPFADTSGIPTACVTKLSKEAGMKVVLSADGGDELFGGYTHYPKAFALYNKIKSLPLGVRKGLSKSLRTIFPPSVRKNILALNSEHKAYALEEILEANDPVKFFEAFVANQSLAEIENLVNAKFNNMSRQPLTEHPLQSMMTWDFKTYLPDDLLVKVDRATMYHGIECREPFLDHRLVEFSMRLPVSLKIKNGKGKYLLRKILKQYIPEEYFERKKQGFSIPLFDWFSNDLDQLFDEHLQSNRLQSIPFLNSAAIINETKKYRAYKKRGKQYNIEKMWRILSFVMWWNSHQHAA